MAKETAQDRIERFKKDNGVFFYKPYVWQERALEEIRRKNTTAIISSNKIGKCLTYQTLIDTTSGKISVGELFEKGKSFDVYAWDGKKKVIAKAQAPFKKPGLHRCYRIMMSDGQWIEAADHHKILCDNASYYSVAMLALLFQSRDISPSYFPPLPLMIDGNKIESIVLISGSQKVYDFIVEKYHNYFAGGLIHHNTCLVVNILLSWLIGYEPWKYIDKDDPEAIEVGGCYYRKSSLGMEPPVNLILTGEDWKLHIGRVLVPELKKWAPKGWYKTKKNEQGVDFFWQFCNQSGKWRNPSTLTIMSYSQDDDLFESFRAQGAIMDEPPPKSKYKAMSRGLLLDNGKTLLSLTPIKEAWILDDIVLSGRKDIGIVDGLKITDNPDLMKDDVDVLKQWLTEIEIGEYFDLLLYEDKEKEKPVSDQGRAAEVYLEKLIPEKHHSDIYKLKILKFIKDIDPDDVPPRVFGTFKSLVGRVLKEFDKDIHIIKPFEVPTDWPVTVMIDFHLSTPQAVSYWAVNKQDINYCVGETWKNISGDEIADDIIRKMKSGWNITEAFIDPLSKGDVAYIRNRMGSDLRDTFSIISEKLAPHGITLQVASKDKDSGIKNIQTWLRGVNGLPTCYIFNDCERHLYEVQRWVFDENGKPAKENDHMMENWYRYSLVGAKYEFYKINPLPVHHQQHSEGAWLGA